MPNYFPEIRHFFQSRFIRMSFVVIASVTILLVVKTNKTSKAFKIGPLAPLANVLAQNVDYVDIF